MAVMKRGENVKKFSPDFQRHIAACYLRLPDFAAQFVGTLDASHFEDKDIQAVVGLAQDIYHKTGSIPTRASMEYVAATEEQLSVLKKIYKDDLRDVEFVKQTVSRFCRLQAAKLAVLECSELLAEGRPDGILKILETALQVGLDTAKKGIRLIGPDRKDLNNRIEGYLNGEAFSERIPTGYKHLDECLGGGISPGELGIFMAPAKRGKTHCLVGTGYGAMVRGYNVVHISLEMKAAKIVQRYDARISSQPMQVLKASPAVFTQDLKTGVENIYQARTRKVRKPRTGDGDQRPARGPIAESVFGKVGDVIVVDWPTRVCTASMIRGYLSRLQASQGFIPHVVIVDYGDIMAPERRKGELRHEIAGQFEDLRTLAGDLNVVVWTATQSNRASADKMVVEDKDTAESFEKIQVADAVISWCRTKKESAVDPQTGYSRGRFFISALREEEQYQTIRCRVDLSKSLIETVGIGEEDDTEGAEITDGVVERMEAGVAKKKRNERLARAARPEAESE